MPDHVNCILQSVGQESGAGETTFYRHIHFTASLLFITISVLENVHRERESGDIGN